MTKAARLTRAGRSYNPKTTLGFYAIVLGIVAGVATVVVVPLAFSPVAWAVPWILVGFAGFAAVLVGSVFIVMVKDVSKLMLQGVSGSEYVEIQTLLGDSVTGERLVVERLTIEEELIATVVEHGDHQDGDPSEESNVR